VPVIVAEPVANGRRPGREGGGKVSEKLPGTPVNGPAGAI
jgi:hypothetical protein